MSRWITSDQQATTTLLQRFGSSTFTAEAIPEPHEALRCLLQSRHSMALLPCESDQHRLVASIHSFRPASAPSASDSAERREPRQVATGFLGLVDELVWEEDEAPRRTWWQKLID
jgi:hypothetical protein